MEKCLKDNHRKKNHKLVEKNSISPPKDTVEPPFQLPIASIRHEEAIFHHSQLQKRDWIGFHIQQTKKTRRADLFSTYRDIEEGLTEE